nr:MAG TPA: hypothetical protein [Caudoviricetes sp.]
MRTKPRAAVRGKECRDSERPYAAHCKTNYYIVLTMFSKLIIIQLSHKN